MQTLDALRQRFSANKFDALRPLNEQQIEELVFYAQQAPSAFNLQHSRFLAITENAAKQQLLPVAFGQQKVVEASATFVVLADLQAHDTMADIARRGQEAGIFDQSTADYLVNTVTELYGNNPQQARDEAIRSASLAAMNLMTAATDMGLVSCPMTGFDPQALAEQFHIADRYLPVMLITVGYEAEGNWPKKPRWQPAEILVTDARPGQPHHFS